MSGAFIKSASEPFFHAGSQGAPRSPGFADESEACDGLEASGEVVRVDEVAQVTARQVASMR
jgi:hypothetical protein